MGEDVVHRARSALATARQLHRQGQDDDALNILVECLDKEAIGSSHVGHASHRSEDVDMDNIHQAMVALGCWLCNALATRHLSERRVARAFGYTRTCERWLAKEKNPSDVHENVEMWLRLRFDCTLNAAELAQTSSDLPKAVAKLKECKRLQDKMSAPQEPEVVHLCLAEALLHTNQYADAAVAAQCAIQFLQPQQQRDERKIYSLLFALSLEQAALAAVGEQDAPPPPRAMMCLPDAEAVWYYDSMRHMPAVDEASQALLLQMRRVHSGLLVRLQGAPRRHTAPSPHVNPVEGLDSDARKSLVRCNSAPVITSVTNSSNFPPINRPGLLYNSAQAFDVRD